MTKNNLEKNIFAQKDVVKCVKKGEFWNSRYKKGAKWYIGMFPFFPYSWKMPLILMKY